MKALDIYKYYRTYRKCSDAEKVVTLGFNFTPSFSISIIINKATAVNTIVSSLSKHTSSIFVVLEYHGYLEAGVTYSIMLFNGNIVFQKQR